MVQKIRSKTKLVGIIGYPLGHTLSPVLHNSLFSELNLDMVYLAFEVIPKRVKNVCESFRTLNVVGANVTIPYKEKIISQLDKVDVLAKEIGAVNTVVNKNDLLVGYNTDVFGFVKSLSDKEKFLSGKKVFMVGCGGVSKAIVCGLRKMRVKSIFVYDIDKKKMFGLTKKYKGFVVAVSEKDFKKVFSEVSMFVNATSVGMRDGDKIVVPAELLKKDVLVYDVIYNRETELLREARKVGCETLSGLDMFVYQAAESFRLWTGVEPPLDYMFSVVKSQLKIK